MAKDNCGDITPLRLDQCFATHFRFGVGPRRTNGPILNDELARLGRRMYQYAADENEPLNHDSLPQFMQQATGALDVEPIVPDLSLPRQS